VCSEEHPNDCFTHPDRLAVLLEGEPHVVPVLLVVLFHLGVSEANKAKTCVSMRIFLSCTHIELTLTRAKLTCAETLAGENVVIISRLREFRFLHTSRVLSLSFLFLYFPLAISLVECLAGVFRRCCDRDWIRRERISVREVKNKCSASCKTWGAC